MEMSAARALVLFLFVNLYISPSFIQVKRRTLGLEEHCFTLDPLGLRPLFTPYLNIKAKAQPLLLGSGRPGQISIPAVRPPLGTKLFFSSPNKTFCSRERFLSQSFSNVILFDSHQAAPARRQQRRSKRFSGRGPCAAPF